MNAFSEQLANYDVGSTYNALESVYRGQYKFDPRVAPLSNPEASIHFLPDPKAGVLNAKYLVEAFVIRTCPTVRPSLTDFSRIAAPLTHQLER